MKTTQIVLLSVALLLTATLPAAAQSGATCNDNRAEGIARSQISACIADAQADDFDVSLQTNCACPGTGYTVTATGVPHCRPGEICPLIVRIVGTVQLDCDFNVIASSCGGSAG